MEWVGEPSSYAMTVRFRWWFARFLGSLSDGRRAVLATTLLFPVTFLAIFLVVLAID